MTLVKWLVLAIFVAILVSLGSALRWLVRDQQGETKQMVRALTVRISLSIALFVLLWVAWLIGWIEPHAPGR